MKHAQSLRFVVAALLAVVAAAWTSTARATTYTICAAGAPTCDADCAGGAALFSALVNGDTVEFEEGLTCSFGFTVGTKSNITIRGQGSGATLDGTGAAETVGLTLYIGSVVERMTIRDFTDCAKGNGGNRVFTIQDSNLLDCGTGVSSIATGGLVQRSTIRATAGMAVNGGTQGPTVRNVLVTGATNGGIVLGTSTSGLIEHCTVTGVSGGTYALRAYTIRFSIAEANTTSICAIGPHTGGSESYNLAHGSSVADFCASPGTGSSTADPLLVGSGDYSLTASSPAIGAATGSTVTDDITGTSRDAAPDVGAYEYVAVATGTAKSVRAGQLGCMVCAGTSGYSIKAGSK
jgi:hypothetical protein